ncbi:MAG: hypothetical protein QOJ38_1142 [Solirubrobacterales bacterium]|nr:hypothetical protein [Solirubrobacterales bacterium]
MSEVEEIEGELVDDGERLLPLRREPGQLERRGEVAAAALVAAGGLVAGAATVAAVRAAWGGGSKRPARRVPKQLARPASVIASRSFLVDIHLLGK